MVESDARPTGAVSMGQETGMAATTTSPDYLTTREVAALLRVRERKVYELAAAGEIPCRRLTGKLLFPRLEIEAWLSGGPADAPQERTPAPDVIAGSHDPLLDWAIRESGSRLATLFDGSLDGLERVGSRQAIAAGMHVYEPANRGWNTDHVAQRLGGEPVVLVEWARRRQGLIMAPATAREVRSIADLRGRRLVQRQAAAGAGLLLQHLMAAEALAMDEVDLLADVMRTETEAAAAVALGRADAAPGLEAMARQFGLAFLPTIEERFDLLVDRRAWFQPPMQRLLGFCRTDAFQAKALELGGYDLRDHGQVHWNGP